MTLNHIARDLRYFGLVRVVDTQNGEVTWASTAQLGERAIYYGSGASPDAALADVVSTALGDKMLPTLDTTLSLDQLASDLLQLVLTRSHDRPGVTWQAVGTFRRRRAFWLVGPWKRPKAIRVMSSLPDEALNELIQQAFRH